MQFTIFIEIRNVLTPVLTSNFTTRDTYICYLYSENCNMRWCDVNPCSDCRKDRATLIIVCWLIDAGQKLSSVERDTNSIPVSGWAVSETNDSYISDRDRVTTPSKLHFIHRLWNYLHQYYLILDKTSGYTIQNQAMNTTETLVNSFDIDVYDLCQNSVLDLLWVRLLDLFFVFK